MRNSSLLLSLAFFIQPFHSFGQLSGKYCHNFGFGVECFRFYGQNQFDYTHVHCTGENTGQGTYKLHGNKLILNFDEDEGEEDANGCNPKLSTIANENDSVSIGVTVFDDEYQEMLIAASIFLTDENESVITGIASDFDGFGMLKVKNNESKIYFNVTYVGYEKCRIPLVPDKNYLIEVHLVAGRGIYIEGEVWNFEFQKNNSRELALCANPPFPVETPFKTLIECRTCAEHAQFCS